MDDKLAFRHIDLNRWVGQVLASAGLRTNDAAEVAESLLYADRRGIRTHGVARVPMYLERIRAGGIRPEATPETLIDAGALCLVHGHAAAGAVTAGHARRLALIKARTLGVGLVLVRGGNDIGALGYQVHDLATKGCVGLVACNTDAIMCAPGGARATLGNNPVAIAFPFSEAVLDMACSAAAYGKVTRAAARGELIPEGWAVDSDGKPTVHPKAAMAGALVPAAGPKGFGLAFMVDALAALSGATTSPFVPSFDGVPQTPQDLGLVVLAIDGVSVAEPDDVAARLGRLIAEVHDGRGPSEEAMYPGEPEHRVLQSLGDDVLVDAEVVAELRLVAITTGVPLPVTSSTVPQRTAGVHVNN